MKNIPHFVVRTCISCQSPVRVYMSIASATFPWLQTRLLILFFHVRTVKTLHLKERNTHTHTLEPKTESVKLSVCWYANGAGLIRSFFLKLGTCFFGTSRQMACFKDIPMYDSHSPKSSNTQNGGSHRCRLHVTLRNPHPTQNKKLYKVQYLHLIRITATIMDNLAWSLSLQNEKLRYGMREASWIFTPFAISSAPH